VNRSRRWVGWYWLRRGAIGLVLAWIWSSLVCLAWVGLAAGAYGDLDLALRQLKAEPWLHIAIAGNFSSVLASALGGVIGPLVVGNPRRSVLNSSARGGAWAAALGTAGGLFVGWLLGPLLPDQRMVVYVALGLSVPAGLVGGWLGGRALMRRDGPVPREMTP
jgi:hypothetical protein